jgi:enoyl-CoA hydratase/carnithine racemase
MGGGLGLALLCDLIVADKMARFGFPSSASGFIPGFGGIPACAVTSATVLFVICCLPVAPVKAEAAHQAGLVTHLAGEGYALQVARSMAQQIRKFTHRARIAARNSSSPSPTRNSAKKSNSSANSSTDPGHGKPPPLCPRSDDPMKHLPVAPKP